MIDSSSLASLLILVLSAVSFVGCATTQGASGGSQNVITQEEIQDVSGISNAYNLVRRLHPQWLEKRGRSSVSNPGDVVVYVNGSRQGGPSALREVDVIDVETIRYLPPDRATMRHGSGHDNGAVEVSLKGG
ncbi:MAG: hypothetical protein R6T83_10260 [Salinibacter sp.]